ncbi:MAG TPA: prolipoprotein diacylglyceryl transferase family protein [Bacilli bacterium]
MPEILQLGPFMIKLDWLLLAVSGLMGYLVMQRRIKQSYYRDKPILDRFSTGLMIVFFVWKFSPVLFTPSILWENPLGLLTMTGSINGTLLGIAAAILYTNRWLRRMKVPRLFFADLLSLGTVVMLFVYNLLGWQYGTITTLPWGVSIEDLDYKYHPVNVYLLLITLPMLIWLWRKSLTLLGTGSMAMNVLIYYGMGLMLVSFFKQKTSLFVGLSGEQILYLLMMFFGLFLSIFLNKNKQQEMTSVGERVEEPNVTAGILPPHSRNAAVDSVRPEDSYEEKRPTLSE